MTEKEFKELQEFGEFKEQGLFRTQPFLFAACRAVGLAEADLFFASFAPFRGYSDLLLAILRAAAAIASRPNPDFTIRINSSSLVSDVDASSTISPECKKLIRSHTSNT